MPSPGTCPFVDSLHASSLSSVHQARLVESVHMTGPRRPGRDNQDCLSAIAARADGWDYPDLLMAMAEARFRAASAIHQQR